MDLATINLSLTDGFSHAGPQRSDELGIVSFHSRLAARGKGAKDWANSWTEVEHLGNGKFAASIGVGHRVFKDKADGKWKKHKLTDERPAKDYVLIQSAKCAVEIHPFYAKYFDVNHTEVRLHEERWQVQRLFEPPDDWRDVDAYNPIISVEEYPEPAGDVVKVTVTYDTDYGVLTVEYFQRDGNTLKHNVTFKNTSGGTEIFRVLQRWAGVVGAKCNGKDFPLDVDEPFLAFHRADKPRRKFTIAENLWSMMFNPDGTEKTEKCLRRPVKIEGHAQGMKTDFIYGNWILAQDESLTVDPDTATLSDPTEDGTLNNSYDRNNTQDTFFAYVVSASVLYRAYVEWNISSIPDGSIITDTVFKYHGNLNSRDCHIHEMLGARPSTSGNQAVYDEAGEGTVYADPVGFPVVGTNQQADLGPSADTDLENQLSSDWFAIGIQLDDETYTSPVGGIIYSEEYATPDPKPTLYVEYTVPPKTITTTDGFSLADVIKTIRTRRLTLADDYSLVDVLATQEIYYRSILDGHSHADPIATLRARPLSLTDAFDLADVLGTQEVYYLILADGYSLTDIVVTLRARPLSLADNYNFADVFSTQEVYQRLLTDAYSLADLTATLRTRRLGLADAHDFADITSTQEEYHRTLQDSYSLADLATTLRSRPLSLADSYVFADVLSTREFFYRTITDAYTLADLPKTQEIYYRSITDGYTLADLLTLFRARPLSLVDGYSLADILNTREAYYRLLEDNFTLADQIVTRRARPLFLADNYSLTDPFAKLLSRRLILRDDYTLADVLSKQEIYFLSLADRYSFADLPSIQEIHNLFLLDAFIHLTIARGPDLDISRAVVVEPFVPKTIAQVLEGRPSDKTIAQYLERLLNP